MARRHGLGMLSGVWQLLRVRERDLRNLGRCCFGLLVEDLAIILIRDSLELFMSLLVLLNFIHYESIILLLLCLYDFLYYPFAV